MVYTPLAALFPTGDPPPVEAVNRVVLIRPCCIGDVVMATAALDALRRLYPKASITWAVGGWSRRVVEGHNHLDAVQDTGPAANPARGPRGVWAFARSLRAGDYDLAVSLVRSPWMSAAVWLSGIRYRAGLDSLGRGFGYNIRATVDPAHPRHEAQIYLDVIARLGGHEADCYPTVPVRVDDVASVRELLAARGVSGDYVVINPNGGNNPGMMMDAKRWPPPHFAALADALVAALGVKIVLLGGPDDTRTLDTVQAAMQAEAVPFSGVLTFQQIAALAQGSRAYVGNDTGLTHMAAAAGARTAMILGPSDPARYGPFTPPGQSIALWQPVELGMGGVGVTGTPQHWDWARDGIGVDAVIEAVTAFINP